MRTTCPHEHKFICPHPRPQGQLQYTVLVLILVLVAPQVLILVLKDQWTVLIPSLALVYLRMTKQCIYISLMNDQNGPLRG